MGHNFEPTKIATSQAQTSFGLLLLRGGKTQRTPPSLLYGRINQGHSHTTSNNLLLRQGLRQHIWPIVINVDLHKSKVSIFYPLLQPNKTSSVCVLFDNDCRHSWQGDTLIVIMLGWGIMAHARLLACAVFVMNLGQPLIQTFVTGFA